MTSSSDHKAEHDKRMRAIIEAAAFPGSALAGYATGELMVRRSIYKNVADTRSGGKSGFLDALQAEHKANKHSILTEAQAETSLSGKTEQLHKFVAENKRFRKALRTEFNKMGFHNQWDHFKALHPNQQTEAVVYGLSTAATLLGAILLITQNRALENELSRKSQSPDMDL